MASADFSQFVVTTHFFRIRLLNAPVRPPRVLTHSFPLYLPYLPQAIPCSYWTLASFGTLSSSGALYMVSVRQARVLPPPFFRLHLTMDALGLGYILPTAGRIRDFHPLERALAGRTSKSGCPSGFGQPDVYLYWVYYISCIKALFAGSGENRLSPANRHSRRGSGAFPSSPDSM